MSFKVEDHYDLRKHLHVDHNMIFYEERKSSCDECHSKSKTTTTWENTCTLTLTWFFMKSEKVHVRIHICIFQEWSQYPNNLSATWNSYNKDTVAFCKCEICTCECLDLMKQLIFQGYGVFNCTKCCLLAGFLFENIVLQVGADWSQSESELD